MLASLGDLPSGDDWVFEVKWDGFRAIAAIDADRRLSITSRNGNDYMKRFPALQSLAGALPAEALPIELDGEIIAFDASGRPSFGALQGGQVPVHFAIFDLTELAGRDTTVLSWADRRKLLETLEIDAENASVSGVYDDGEALLEQMIERGMEGVIAKRRSSRYHRGARGRDWIKVKPKPTQEFVIGGWTGGTGHREETFGALMLGYFEEGADRLSYVGNVGSGFDDRALDTVMAALRPLASDADPFKDADEIRNSHFVMPMLVAEIEYGETTADGRLRHPVFKGLRDDKPADEVRFERKH